MNKVIWGCIAVAMVFGLIYGVTISGASAVGVPVIVGIGALFYFIPSFVATSRSHPNETAITILNIVAGWTLLGWVVALVWACLRIKPED